MTAFDMLPFVRGWCYQPITLAGQTIKEKITITDLTGKKGWFLFVAGVFNDPNTVIRIVTDVYFGKSITPFALYTAGLTASNNSGVWVQKFDTINNIYAPIYAPPYPLPFNSSMKIELSPSSSGPFTLTNYGHLLILITDEKLFLGDLKKVLGKGLK